MTGLPFASYQELQGSTLFLTQGTTAVKFDTWGMEITQYNDGTIQQLLAPLVENIESIRSYCKVKATEQTFYFYV